MKYLEMEAALRKAGWKYAGNGRWAAPNWHQGSDTYDLFAASIKRVNDDLGTKVWV